jgi:hypothetical protein
MTQVSGIWYHGTQKQFDKFLLPPKYSPNEQLGFGIHFAKKKDFAEVYGTVIYHCRLHPRNILDVSQGMAIKPGTKYDALAKEFLRGSRPYFIDKEHYVFGQGSIDIKNPKRAEAIIRKYGYDAVLYEAKYGTRTFDGRNHGANYSHKTPAMVMLDNARIEIVTVGKIK